MARSNISAQAVGDAGLNITDMTMTTMSAGANNGVMVPYSPANKLLLRNGTGGDAVYTIKVPTPGAYSGKGVTIPDVTVTLATGKDMIYKLSPLFKQSDDKVYVDCDVAAKIAAITP
ncbi:MAG: hypothetical protein KJ077_08080 [Anaerolineae bacterium]|nr:hypothetical protein [Anaerolineae bacterium]